MLTAHLYGIAVRHELPDYVKTADLNELVADTLHPQGYADVAGRQYPLHTKAACVFSAAQISELPESALRKNCVQRVKAAATEFGVLKDVESVLHPVAPAQDPSMFAWKDESGNALPIRTAVDMQKTANWLLENRPKMPLDRCRQISLAIIKRAEETGTVLANREAIYQLAGAAAPDIAGLKRACEWRARTLQISQPDVSRDLRTIADQLSTQPVTLKTASTVVNTLDYVDGRYGLRPLYAQGMPKPESGYGVTAEQLQLLKESMVVTASGDVFDKTAFARITTDQIAGWMGEGFLNKTASEGSVCVEKLTHEVQNLSRVDANRFAKMAGEIGIKPIGRVAPSQPLVA